MVVKFVMPIVFVLVFHVHEKSDICNDLISIFVCIFRHKYQKSGFIALKYTENIDVKKTLLNSLCLNVLLDFQFTLRLMCSIVLLNF